jgi:PAS domain S-box-containing protein
MSFLTIACLSGIMPPFFIQGVGSTPLRLGILGTADILFIFSFIIFIGIYSRNKEVFLYWYALALALTAISLTAFLIQRSVGSPVGWAGRFSQYVGGVYFLVALITAAGSARSRKTSLANVLTASLCSSDEQFRALAEHSPDIICRFDRELKHIYLNLAGLRMLGKPAAAIIGKTIEEAGAPEPYSSLWKERIQKVFETGRQLDVEYYFPAPEGQRFYQSRCVPEYGADGTVKCALVVSHDITGRKRAEEALRESEERYRLLAETLSQGVIHHDACGRILSMNPAAEHILGKSSKQSLGTSPVQEEHGAIRENGELFPGIEHPSMAALHTGVPVRGIVMGVFNPIIGDYRWISIDAVPGFRPGETCPSEVHTVFEDITERKLAEEQISILNEQLKHQVDELNTVNKDLEAFGYSVSHDLRAPLRHILGFADLLKERLTRSRDEKARDYADLISTSSNKMSALVDDLLNFSRLGRSEMHKLKVNMNDLVKGIVQELQLGLKERKIRWEIGELPDVFCDRSLLRLAIVNLVSNAVKFTSPREEAEIRIGCKDEEDKFVFSVSDNGVGFDMKSSGRLFGVFRRLHTQEEFEGTGIGLANVQRIISRHGGSVWAEGIVGQGATFYFTLPKATEA